MENVKITKEKSFSKEVMSWIIDILIVVIVVYFITSFVGQRTSVLGESMEPTLHDNDQIVIDKISYRFSKPERFDVIVFPYKMNPKQFYIKRIIGLPGETVQIKDSKIFIDGEELKEDFGLEPILNYGRADEPILIGEDEYFVLGDNRNNSSDSRQIDVGNISREDIIGKAWIRIWPLKNVGFLKHD